MNNVATSVYEEGVLRLDTPLELPEHTRVQVYVQPIAAPEAVVAHRKRVHDVLVAAGLSLPITEEPSTLACFRKKNARSWQAPSRMGVLYQR